MEEVKGEMKETISEKEIEKRKSNLKKFFFGWVKDNYDKIFIAVLILAFIVRLWIFFKTMNQPFWWDEADYMSAAKRWAGITSISDIWYYRRGFLWPLIGSLFFRLNIGEISMRFLVVLLSTGIIAVSYAILSKMFDKKIALIATTALSFSWILLFFTGRILTDIPATFFILLSLLFFWKGYVMKEGNKFLYFFGISFALAVLTRMQSFMLFPPFLIYIFVKEKFKMFKNKQLWITVGIFILLLIPQFVLYTLHYGNPLTDIASHYFGIGSSSDPVQDGTQRGLTTAIFNYFTDLPYMLSIPIFLLFIIGIFYFFGDLFIGFDKIFKDENLQKKFFIFNWIVFLFLIMGYIGQISYVEERYISAALPFLFLIAIYPLLSMGKFIAKHSKIDQKMILSIIFIVVLLLLIPNVSNTLQLTDAKLSSYSQIQQAGLWIKANSNSTDLIMTASRPQILYYAERAVQSDDPHMWDNQSYFENEVKQLKPQFLVLSVFEQSPDWLYNYPSQNPSKLTPVKAYYQGQQPVVVIYKFNYS